MLKVEIVMDEEKILAENKYPLKDIYFTLDKAFANRNLLKGGDGMYLGKGTNQDFANCGSVIYGLQKQDWFIENVKKWLWYNSDDGVDENDFEIDDLLLHYAQRASVGA